MTPCTIDDIQAYEPPTIYRVSDGWPPLARAKRYGIAALRTENAKLRAEVAALRERLTLTPDIRWWHETPYPEDIWAMTTEQYVAAVPDPHLRTAISGYLMRAGWKAAAQTIKEALEEAALLAAGMEEAKP